MAKATKKTEAKTVTIEQIGSPIRRPAVQRATLVGLAPMVDRRLSKLGVKLSLRSFPEAAPSPPCDTGDRRAPASATPSNGACALARDGSI